MIYIRYLIYDTFNLTEGAIDTFEGHDILGQCYQFDMKHSTAQTIMMTLNHEGMLFTKIKWDKTN